MNLMKFKNVQLNELGRLVGEDVTMLDRFKKIEALKGLYTDEQAEEASRFTPEEEDDNDVEPAVQTDDDEAEDDEPANEEEAAPVVSVKQEPVEESNEVEEVEYVLIKMERRNPRYETHGKVFTKEHPYAAVPEPVAAKIIKEVKGFRPALPSEVKEYYGK